MSEQATEQTGFKGVPADSVKGGTGLQQWRIGDVTVTKIVEIGISTPIEYMFHNGSTEAMRKIAWLEPHFMTPDGLAILSIHALIIETPTGRIIVDTCIGNDKERATESMDRLQTSFLTDLEAAGFTRDSFDTVLCTHMHIDHVGWNTMLVDGQWVPTFPRARYLLNRTEFDYWQRDDETIPTVNDWALIQRQTFADSVMPILNAGLVDLVEGEHRVCDEVTLIPTIGHSPGHVSVRIRSKGEEALITGDMTHHPSQLVHVDWGLDIDHDPAQAIRTREAVFGDSAARGVLVIGTHWAGATAGRIVRDGDAYRLEVSSAG